MALIQCNLAPFINQEFAVTGAWGEQRAGHIHAGIDLASVGSGGVAKPIYSMSEGIVTRVDQTDQGTGYGAMCIIWNQTNNDLWLYGDIEDNSIPLTVGQTVQQGTYVGLEGNPAGTASTGLHVHLEKENQSDGVFKFGYTNSIDPVAGTGIQNVVYSTSGETYIFNGTPVPPTAEEKKGFNWPVFTKVNKQEEKYQADIQRLKEQKEKLIETNGNLLLQVSVAEDNISQGNNKVKEEEAPKPYDFRTAIDEFGNFIH